MEACNWYCIYTKPHYEDHVAQYLTNHWDLESFNPKLKTRKYMRGRIKEVVEALFPCYIFSCFDPAKHYHMIKYTRGVRKIVGDQTGNPYIVDEEVIGQIQSRMKEGFIHIDPPDFNEGDRVVVQEGTLKGLTGIFQRELKARDRVMILLNTLSYQASVEIEKGFLVRA